MEVNLFVPSEGRLIFLGRRQKKCDMQDGPPVAVSSSSGQLILQPGCMNWGDNRIVTRGSPARGQIQVDAVSLDEFFAGRKADFLKIDVQGWEAAALFGARRLWRRMRISS